MKKLYFTAIVLLNIQLNAQIEIIDVKRFMSAGEKEGVKMTIPNQNKEKFEKLQNDWMKKNGASLVKQPKGSNEIQYKNVYLKGTEKPMNLFVVLDQENKNVGWTGYFLIDSTNQVTQNKPGVTIVLQSLFNVSMNSLYDDSITIQNKLIKETTSLKKDQGKEAEKCQKNINNAKDKIRDAESEIQSNQSSVDLNKGKIAELQSKLIEAEAKLKDAQVEMKKTKDIGTAVDELMSKHKKQLKSLKELEKDSEVNANLIIAQSQDIAKLAEEINLKSTEFKSAESAAKILLKGAEKEADNAKDNLKDAEKAIKKGNQKITDNNETIIDQRKKIEENEKAIEKYISIEKGKTEEELKKLNERLEELKTIQKRYL
ncbi:MAG: hypothetical protein ACOVP5_02330 [Chitinophagales bacterium]